MKKKNVNIVIIIGSILILLILVFRFLSPEDSWVCADGRWVAHGHPSISEPQGGCGSEEKLNEKSDIKTTDNNEYRTVKVYFGNSKLDPKVSDCGLVFPIIKPINNPDDIYRGVLENLLAGPSEFEASLGYFSSINPGVSVKKVEFNDGKILVDFSASIQTAVGGSCRVTAIRSQIEKTLKQFLEVKEVVISVEGNVAEALQP